MRSLALLCTLAALSAGLAAPAAPAQNPLRFSVTFPAERSAGPLDGRLLLLLTSAPPWKR